MGMTLFFPVRVAVGALAWGADKLKRLPEDLPSLAVTAVGSAMRASLRVQQEVAALAERGDEVLAPLLHRPEEQPAWARFDEDEDTAGSTSTGRDRSPEHDASGSSDVRLQSSPAREGHSRISGNEPPGPLPEPVHDYASLSVGELRLRLPLMSRSDVATLLSYERRGQDRAAYVTTLENRLISMDASHDVRHRA